MASMDMSDWGWNARECECAAHPEECGCLHCHQCRFHDWRQWRVYPPCLDCQAEMEEWLATYTDYFELQRQAGIAA